MSELVSCIPPLLISLFIDTNPLRPAHKAMHNAMPDQHLATGYAGNYGYQDWPPLGYHPAYTHSMGPTPMTMIPPVDESGRPNSMASPQQPIGAQVRTRPALRTLRSHQHHLSMPLTPPVPLSPQHPHPAYGGPGPALSDAAGSEPPVIRRFVSRNQLMPVKVVHPKSRRALPDGGFMSPLVALTTNLASTYHICDPGFDYQLSHNPRRILTEPHEPKLNGGYDNVESDFILHVNDILGTDENRRYLVLNVLGKGTFGQVVKCQNMVTKEVVAVKVIKNKPAYLNQSMMEVSILEHIQQHVDLHDEHNLLRLKDKFVHKEHLCLVFELLSLNLYEFIKKNQFRGLEIGLVRIFAAQLLDSLKTLKNARLIHCDLKPENILLKHNGATTIKIIDFGSACHERQTVYTYIQSRFYRSPEVILGLPYTSTIDMWSFGCIVAELFLGLPIFPGTSEYNQWSRIVDSLGYPPEWMMEMGKNTANFMKKVYLPDGRSRWVVRPLDEQNRQFGKNEKPSKQYFNSTDLREVIMSYPLLRPNMTKSDIQIEMAARESLADFVRGCLILNPFERWTPTQAAMHPFITGQPWTGPFIPIDSGILQQGITDPSWRAPPNSTAVYATQQPIQTRRGRSATIGQPMGPVPVPGPLQRAAERVDPSEAIHLQASPAYIPPPELYRQV